MEENLTVEELKFFCDVFFRNKPLPMLYKLLALLEIAKEEKNLKLAVLIEKDIATMVKSTGDAKCLKKNCKKK